MATVEVETWGSRGTGVLASDGREIAEGDIITFGDRRLRVVWLNEDANKSFTRTHHREANRAGEHDQEFNGSGHNGFYAQELLVQGGELHIQRTLLLAMNPAQVKIISRPA